MVKIENIKREEINTLKLTINKEIILDEFFTDTDCYTLIDNQRALFKNRKKRCNNL